MKTRTHQNCFSYLALICSWFFFTEIRVALSGAVLRVICGISKLIPFSAASNVIYVARCAHLCWGLNITFFGFFFPFSNLVISYSSWFQILVFNVVLFLICINLVCHSFSPYLFLWSTHSYQGWVGLHSGQFSSLQLLSRTCFLYVAFYA